MAKRNLEVGAPLPSCVCACIHTQLCPTLCNPMNCGPQGSSVHGIFQARILEWVVISYSRGSSPPRDQTCVSRIGRQIFCHWYHLGSLGSVVKNLPAKQETWVRSLGWENDLE